MNRTNTLFLDSRDGEFKARQLEMADGGNTG